MTPQTKANLLRIATENAEELYEQFESQGLWVTEDDLPSDPFEFSQQELDEVFRPAAPRRSHGWRSTDRSRNAQVASAALGQHLIER